MYNSQYYTCEQIDQRLLQGYLDDYNSQNNTNLTKAEFLALLFNTLGRNSTVDNLVTQIGYYECDTAAGTAAKVLSVANYALFAGGAMKVKFVNKNTANNATLNINSNGAKALYYQGERASSTHSWDDNEVVEIYYDGTSYYANNINGGSGSGVYDVSKEHPTSGPNGDGKFTLEYILNSSNVNELIPVNKRKPGMTIQFVSTSDNKYVRFNYLLSSTTDANIANVANWQGVDEEPESGSHNLVESGGVKELFDSQYGLTTADFALADPDGYEIARFTRGHIKTKNFDSEFSIASYIKVENDELVDFSLKDENGISLAQLKLGHIKTKHFYSKDVLERIAQLEYNQNPNTVYCVGDSITQGQTGIISPTDDEEQVNRYPDKLKVMVGDSFEVVNLGVGGQKPNEIFARMGWLDLLTDEDFTLPADTSIVAAPSFIGSNDAMGANYHMQQGTTEAMGQMSRCWMNGVKCALSFSNNTLYINRVTAASKSTFFPSGTNVTFSGEKGLGIYLLYVGQNGTQKDDANLFLGEVKAATSRISGKFLVLGLFTSVAANKTKFDACNALLQKEFGSRYVDPQYICSQQAFDDLGYTPTEDSDIIQDRYDHGVRSDAYLMERGLLPSSFWRYSWTSNYQSIDGIHLNSLGYTAMARMFYNKMKALKWV